MKRIALLHAEVELGVEVDLVVDQDEVDRQTHEESEGEVESVVGQTGVDIGSQAFPLSVSWVR